MKGGFLEHVVSHLLEEYEDKMSHLCFVLPNKRAGLFLKKVLSAKIKQNTWSPEILSIDEFVEKLSGFVPLDQVSLLFDFYQHYKKIEGDNARPFDEFIKWGPTLLSDFNEIDMYLQKAPQLFDYVNEVRAMEIWNTDGSSISKVQQNYLEFWASLSKYYTSFTAHLKDKRQSYSGLAYKTLAQTLNDEDLSTVPLAMTSQWEKIVFAGFNAMTQAEESIINALVAQDKALIFWDSDRYYTQNPMQEAGRFLRKYKKKPSPFNWEFDILSQDEKSIRITGVASNVGQAKVTGDILSNSQNSNDFQDTAVVLADEQLLTPMLQSLPDPVKNVNITMGYPLKHTPLHGLLMLIFSLHENTSRIGKGREHLEFYHKDIIKILNHALIKNLVKGSELSHSLVIAIREHNKIFLSPNDIANLVDPSIREAYEPLQVIFSNWGNDSEEALFKIKAFLENMSATLLEQKPSSRKRVDIDLEYIYVYLKAIHRLQVLLNEYESIKGLTTLKLVFNRVVGNQTVPFYGEPLMGLQVMGMLETRLLDFDHVILVSANEDKLPEGKSQSTFIPYELRKEFGLPTHTDKDAIYAYHFYRLLQRSKKIDLLYNTEPDDLGGGEKSRFITQLLYELPIANPNVKIQEQVITLPLVKTESSPTFIPKDEWIFKRINYLMQNGISPSAFNRYINCPLDFYLKYLVGLRDEDEVEEIIEPTTLGEAVHDTLETLYVPFEGTSIREADVEQMHTRVDELVKESFLKRFNENDLERGKNLLTTKVASKFIHDFLEHEKKEIAALEADGKQLVILQLEREMELKMLVDDHEVKIVGKADRIDRIESLQNPENVITRIIDYKTGVAMPNDLKVADLSELSLDPAKAKAFQLLTYALLYRFSEKDTPVNLESGIISFRKLSEGLMTAKVNDVKILHPKLLNQFKLEIENIVRDICDREIGFEHDTESTYCRFCEP